MLYCNMFLDAIKCKKYVHPASIPCTNEKVIVYLKVA